MKRIVLAGIISIALISGASAQNGNNICVYNAISNFKDGGGADELERGMKCSDEAAVNEATINVSKTWFYRGQLYSLVFDDSALRLKNVTSAFEAVKAFTKLQSLNDPKFKNWDEVSPFMDMLSADVFNEGVTLYNANNYAQAFKYFYSIKDLDTIYGWKKMKPKVELEKALSIAVKSAENAADTADELKVYKELLDLNPTGVTYANYAIALRKTGQPKDYTAKIVDMGLAVDSSNAALLIEKINILLDAGKVPDAIRYINQALKSQPKNDMLWFVKGLAYEKTNDDSLMYAYKKAVEINPKNFKAQYNLGAHYYNLASKLSDELNKLGNSEAELKKYNELKQRRKEYFIQAKPYFDKALAADPTDQQTQKALSQIKSYTAE